MMHTLKLKGYRGFEEYELHNLARVNLLVGKNNCGKTSILEAIRFLESGGNPFVLGELAERRGEVDYVDDPNQGRPTELPNFRHFFFGHHLEPGMGFSLSSNANASKENRRVTVDIIKIEDEIEAFLPRRKARMKAVRFEVGEETIPLGLYGLRIKGDVFGETLPVTEDGSLEIESVRRYRWSRRSRPPSPIRFLTADSLGTEEMSSVWDDIVIKGRQREVIEAMKILVDDLESIDFLTGRVSRWASNQDGIMVGRSGDRRPVPLGSYGGGMRRLLALSLALVQTSGGFLLIDEVDTGLHWTVMEAVWRLVVHAARQSSIQVFATTHSYDCIRGLAALIESRPDFAGDVSIQKVAPSLSQAVSLDHDAIRVAVEQDIEIR